jgi:hypothetical protein
MPKAKHEAVIETETIDMSVTKVEVVDCGHINRHSIGIDNKPDNPACDLPKGHAGDHHGVHKMKVERERFYERETGRLLKIEYDEAEAETHWSDMAGTPVKDIKPGPLPSRSKKSEIMQVVEQLIQG